MSRTSWACLLFLVATSTGCRMCASPYDYCGPLYGGGDCNCHSDNPRRGSVLGYGGGCADGSCADGSCADGSCGGSGPGGDYADGAVLQGTPGDTMVDDGTLGDAGLEGGAVFEDGQVIEEGMYEWQRTEEAVPAEELPAPRPIPDARMGRADDDETRG